MAILNENTIVGISDASVNAKGEVKRGVEK